MDIIITDINWIAVVVGAVAAYTLGAVWYSEVLFVKKWKAGIGVPVVSDRPLAFGMIAQAFGTALLAWAIGVAVAIGSLEFAVLIGLTLTAFMKASGLYAGNSKYAIAVEAGYMLAMVAVMLLAHTIV